MNCGPVHESRDEAVARAAKFSPFLRDALQARPEIRDAFLGQGAEAAAALALGDADSRLRRQRHGLALAVALGDLSGELPLEHVTRLLSDFADSAIHTAVVA